MTDEQKPAPLTTDSIVDRRSIMRGGTLYAAEAVYDELVSATKPAETPAAARALMSNPAALQIIRATSAQLDALEAEMKV